MPRIKPGTLVLEIPPEKYATKVLEVLELVQARGVEQVGFLLEPTVIDTEESGRTLSVAVGPLSLIMEGLNPEALSDACKFKSECRLYVSLKDCWASFAIVPTSIVIAALKTLRSVPEEYELDEVAIKFVKQQECKNPVIIDSLSVKYPPRVHKPLEDKSWHAVRLVNTLKGLPGIPLAICIEDSEVRVTAWVLARGDKYEVHIEASRNRLEHPVYTQVLLDVLIYTHLRKGTAVN